MQMNQEELLDFDDINIDQIKFNQTYQNSQSKILNSIGLNSNLDGLN